MKSFLIALLCVGSVFSCTGSFFINPNYTKNLLVYNRNPHYTDSLKEVLKNAGLLGLASAALPIPGMALSNLDFFSPNNTLGQTNTMATNIHLKLGTPLFLATNILSALPVLAISGLFATRQFFSILDRIEGQRIVLTEDDEKREIKKKKLSLLLGFSGQSMLTLFQASHLYSTRQGSKVKFLVSLLANAWLYTPQAKSMIRKLLGIKKINAWDYLMQKH